jgi:segregation and condensation protein B
MTFESTHLKPIIEAALLAAGQPLTIAQLAELFDDGARPTHTELAQVLEQLAADCAERGVELVEVASGFRYQVKTEVHAFVARLWTERASKYSRAMLETLALIAYRQPITRGEIEAVRGVAVSTQIIKTLEEREWIRVIGHRDVPGRPALYGTTRSFLDYFNLKSLDQLPTLAEIRDLDAMEPELSFPERDGTHALGADAAPIVAAALEVPSTETRQ